MLPYIAEYRSLGRRMNLAAVPLPGRKWLHKYGSLRLCTLDGLTKSALRDFRLSFRCNAVLTSEDAIGLKKSGQGDANQGASFESMQK